jgi:hypothetical protein
MSSTLVFCFFTAPDRTIRLPFRRSNPQRRLGTAAKTAARATTRFPANHSHHEYESIFG